MKAAQKVARTPHAVQLRKRQALPQGFFVSGMHLNLALAKQSGFGFWFQEARPSVSRHELDGYRSKAWSGCFGNLRAEVARQPAAADTAARATQYLYHE